jgi:hypothetical protein
MEMGGTISREDIIDIEESFTRIGILKFCLFLAGVIIAFQLGFCVSNYIGR